MKRLESIPEGMRNQRKPPKGGTTNIRDFLKRSRLILWLAPLLLAMGGCVINQPSPAPSAARRVFDPKYADWNSILTRYVSPAGVDYARMKQDKADGLLEVALTEMAQVTQEQFDSWPREAKLALLINAHNAHAMARVLRHYPVASLGQTVSLLSSARGVRNIRLLGREWSLASLADEVTGYPYHETRALFLLNWAARDCPPLYPAAVTAQNVEGLLERQTQAFLGDPARYEYNPQKHILYVSRLIKWNQDPIERDYQSVWDFLKRYLPKSLTDQIGQRKVPPRLRYLPFDKSLNDAKKAA